MAQLSRKKEVPLAFEDFNSFYCQQCKDSGINDQVG